MVKLVVDEAETAALRRAAEGWARRASSDLSRVEVGRALRRLEVDAALGRAVTRTVTLLAITDEILDAAIELSPLRLRSLDAIHLASARSLGDDLGVFVSYDEGLLVAAQHAGLPVLAPR